MNYGPTIKELRKLRGLSQEGLAKKARLSAAAICKAETGSTQLNKESLQAVSDALGVSVGAILVLSITEADVAEEKLPLYHAVYPAIRRMSVDLFLTGNFTAAESDTVVKTPGEFGVIPIEYEGKK